MTEKTPKRNKRKIIIFGALILLGLILFLAWFFIIRDTSPASVTSSEAIEARNETLSSCSAEGTEDVNGTWLVATDCGTFDESCLTEVCATSFAVSESKRNSLESEENSCRKNSKCNRSTRN